jgi:uncharacterized protein GlcG (DUF336 family)
VASAVSRAEELGVRSVIAVVDDGGNLTALCRMDGAPAGSKTFSSTGAEGFLLGGVEEVEDAPGHGGSVREQ